MPHRYGIEGYKEQLFKDWLFPVRDLEKLEFGNLQRLEVVILWSRFVTPKYDELRGGQR
jgi:hypothetical protein